jgi:2,3-diaminopropionate biosynthesis protein SbnB
MLYLSNRDVEQFLINWEQLLEIISKACKIHYECDFCQPVKPYVSFKDSPNRIIAMPAYLGGDINQAGIKWIASFPSNFERNLSRAQSVTILNNCLTGTPECIINSSLVSAIRTAAVTGTVIQEYLKMPSNNSKEHHIGIVGFGLIAQYHLKMLATLFAENIKCISIYDPRGVDTEKVPKELRNKINIVQTWQTAFDNADVFITATTSSKGYIDGKARPGSLHLNVSLRDYVPEFSSQVDFMVVDNWEEICRQNTDIECMHNLGYLNKRDTLSLMEILANSTFKTLTPEHVIMFNPMGMAVFDIAVGAFVAKESKIQKLGIVLD